MRKICSVIFVISLAVLMSSPVLAINGQAYFTLDTDLTQAGRQEMIYPIGIGPDQYVGFAVYVHGAEALRGFNIDVTWDPTLAAFSTKSDVLVEEDDININGADITLGEELNVLEDPTKGPGEVKEDGHYYVAWAKFGGDDIVPTGEGLVYYFVLKTSETFSAELELPVTIKVTVGSTVGGTTSRYLGQRSFVVNRDITPDVKTSTWGNIKRQYKDF